MNVTPEVIGRLRRLAPSVAKTKKVTQPNCGSERNGEANKAEELETNAKQNEESETNSASRSSTGNIYNITSIRTHDVNSYKQILFLTLTGTVSFFLFSFFLSFFFYFLSN